jgi:hypothetical protein
VNSENKASRLRGWGSPWAVPKGLFVREFLLEHCVAYGQEIWWA